LIEFDASIKADNSDKDLITESLRLADNGQAILLKSLTIKI
jgi:hypothetical protein